MSAGETLSVVALDEMIGRSDAALRLRCQLGAELAAPRSLLLRGEPGTGKGFVAQLLAQTTCPRPLRRRGAELGPLEVQAWASAAAPAPRCLVVEEIAETSPATQLRLAEVLAEASPRSRLLLTTSRDLDGLARKRELPPALVTGLESSTLWLPPLRARAADVEPLALHFLAQVAQRLGRIQMSICPEAHARLRAHRWAGNITELRDTVERAAVLSKGDVLEVASIERAFEELRGLDRAMTPVTRLGMQMIRSDTLAPGARIASLWPKVLGDLAPAQAMRRTLERALEHSHGSFFLAARVLRIGEQRLRDRLVRHGLG